MDLDEIEPAKWALLDAATDQYIAEEDAAFDSCARLLVHHMADTRGRLSHITTLALGQPPPCFLLPLNGRLNTVKRAPPPPPHPVRGMLDEGGASMR
jgi:hypothetical protein